jgi:predicted hydrocarbon binding protein
LCFKQKNLFFEVFMRTELGEFSSIVCFKAVVTGSEEALGEKAAAIALISAGRQRGKQLADQLGVTGKGSAGAELVPLLQKALGKDGTRLCIVDKIEDAGEAISVYCRETICSAGESEGSPRKLTFTLGAIQGVLEQVLGKRLRGKQTESVLRGSSHDVITFEVIG